MYGAGMITEGMGLIHPVMSYCGDITISFTSCREMLPDPANYAACLQASFDELAAATTQAEVGAGAQEGTGAKSFDDAPREAWQCPHEQGRRPN